MRLVLKTTALAIHSILFSLLLGRLVAVEIYSANFPSSPLVKELRANPLRIFTIDWL
tara:strand:- start:564 stop:734 length:171 start_codon:yes stop_codon:yes gene_type:complete